nr:hypothetical protein [Tanacetum cinerariifolium]
MATTIEQQVALDEALVPSAQRLRFGRSNFRLPSDIQSKESTLQVVYDVQRRSPFFNAFLVTADVPEIYMQEFWATATVRQHSIRFKMDTKKHIVNLEAFREMLHINRVKSLEVNFSELMRTNQSTEAVSNILGLVHQYMHQEITEAVQERRRPPTPDRDWNKTLPAAQGNAQSWISALAKQTDARSSFNELLDTPIDFSNLIMNRLSVDTLTPELLVGPTNELMRGS